MSKGHTLLVAFSLFVVIVMLHFIPKVDSYKADNQKVILQDSITARVYAVWGEGDMGEDMNYYLLTGEKTDFFAIDSEEDYEEVGK